MRITRRDFLNRTIPLAVSASAFTAAELPPFTSSAQAETPAPQPAPDLMDPGPLPDRILGSPTAPLTIIEYSSMTCSHCAEFAITTLSALKKEFIDTGKARYISREFPLDDLAAVASMLPRSVAEERYYPVLEVLFQQQRQWLSNRIQPLMTLAVTQLGFTEDSFNACVADRKLLGLLAQAQEHAQTAFKVSSTPTFFMNGEKVFTGYMTIQQIRDQVASRLKS